MKKSYLLGAVCACLTVISVNANAAIIDNTTYTTDTASGLDWLDLTETVGRTYDDISSKFGSGQEFDGWRYATLLEVTSFWNAFGGNDSYYNTVSTQNNGLTDTVSPLWGYTNCDVATCDSGLRYSWAITANTLTVSGTHGSVFLSDYAVDTDEVKLTFGAINDTASSINIGHALVRGEALSAVPVPAAAWLFGSGLLGLIGVARRKKSA